MKQLLRSFALAAALTGSMAAMAQLPYSVTITGTVTNCNGNSYAHIVSMGGTVPAIDIDVPVLPPSCSFTVTLNMQSQGGGFTVSAPCNGAVLSQVVQYQVPPALDSTGVSVTLNCGSAVMDCLGVLGGSALPGTPCTNMLGQNGTWNANCECVPLACNACFTISSPQPWIAAFTNCTSGIAPFVFNWALPNGGTASSSNAEFVFNAAGIYGVCLTMQDMNGCSSTVCDTVYVDANGGITTTPTFYDCLQIPNGPNVPGAPCTTALGINGTWSASCECIPSAASCQACITAGPVSTPNGSIIPWAVQATNCSQGTAPFTYLINWGDGTMNASGDHAYTAAGTYQVCIILSDANGCTSTACDSVVIDANGTVNPPVGPGPCEAGFWVLQAYEIDSLNPNGGATPIPNVLWVWNLSSGSGNFQFLWSFGDGTSSTDAFPTHVYASGGPYTLCLTMWDNTGCTSTYCDEVSVDADGIFTGLAPEQAHERSAFTIQVINELPTGIGAQPAISELSAWPNPAQETLQIAFSSSMRGSQSVQVIDLNGRTVMQLNTPVASGSNRASLPIGGLQPGMYLLRAGSGKDTMNIRFIKQ